jgi:hypothetical protein
MIKVKTAGIASFKYIFQSYKHSIDHPFKKNQNVLVGKKYFFMFLFTIPGIKMKFFNINIQNSHSHQRKNRNIDSYSSASKKLYHVRLL